MSESSDGHGEPIGLIGGIGLTEVHVYAQRPAPDGSFSGCPHVHVVATSREPLGIDGEVAWRVPSLAVPDGTTTVAELAQSPAVQLFVERATAAQPRFTLTERNSAAVLQIC